MDRGLTESPAEALLIHFQHQKEAPIGLPISARIIDRTAHLGFRESSQPARSFGSHAYRGRRCARARNRGFEQGGSGVTLSPSPAAALKSHA